MPGYDAVGLRVERPDTDIQVLAVVDNADLGVFGCRLAIQRLALAETADPFGVIPGGFVECPVESNSVSIQNALRPDSSRDGVGPYLLSGDRAADDGERQYSERMKGFGFGWHSAR